MQHHEKREKTLLTKEVLAYITNHSVAESFALRDLRADTLLFPVGSNRISTLDTVAFLQFLVKIQKPKTILEVGTFTGYATLALALAAPEAHITTIEKDDRFATLAQSHWKKSDVADNITFHLADAHEILTTLKESHFDFIYLDANKRDYVTYYESLLPLLAEDGILIVDNTLWSGDVIEVDPTDKKVAAIKEFNTYVANDTRVSQNILPIGDGVTVIMKN